MYYADRYYGYGGMPPPHGYPPGPPGSGHPPHIYPYGPGVVFYPVHPAYFYPPHGHPHPGPPPDSVQVVDSEPEEAVPELPGETVELPWSKSKPGHWKRSRNLVFSANILLSDTSLSHVTSLYYYLFNYDKDYEIVAFCYDMKR